MVKRLLFLILIFYTFLLQAQEPTINWGPAIPYTSRNLNNLQILGTGAVNSFYTFYAEGRLTTLERYDQHHQRIWVVAIVPLGPDGRRAEFEDLILLNQQVYLISSITEKYKKHIFAQQIDANGNYMSTIHKLATTLPGALVYTKTNGPRLLLTLQQQAEPQQTSVSLYYGSFKPHWSATIPVKGDISDMRVSETGTSFILTQLPATNSPEAAFYLYRFEGRNGKSSTQAIGSTAQRPLQAKMAAHNSDLIVAGITTPAPFVASLHPEPTGTFYYRFPKGRFRNQILNYTPLDSIFLHDYKAYKPDKDHSQRLRYLQLQHLLPFSTSRVALIGEVYTIEKNQNHTDDILVTTFAANGSPIYTISANKHQSGPVNAIRLGSNIATTIQDTLKLIYLDFEYNYNEKGEIIMASPKAVLKTPVLVTILPDGTQKVKPLRDTETGRHQNFYLVPSSAYKVNSKEFIVLGSGNGYYKFGKLTF